MKYNIVFIEPENIKIFKVDTQESLPNRITHMASLITTNVYSDSIIKDRHGLLARGEYKDSVQDVLDYIYKRVEDENVRKNTDAEVIYTNSLATANNEVAHEHNS
ncbi:hypothetical protein [Ralstonia phage RP13]|nr:hypothetical protein [Ralstonia phage RP13]